MPVHSQRIVSALQSWDGKTTATLKQVYDEQSQQPDFLQTLITLLNDNTELADGATWLLKHHVENGNELPPEAIENVSVLSNRFQSWPARLHILQLLTILYWPKAALNNIEKLVRQSLKSDNKFVRAAAYECFFCLVKYNPHLRDELLSLSKLAMETESASVKVKLRQILKGMQTNP